MITKIEACEIEYQFNFGLFVWNCDNPIKSKPKTNYKCQFSINLS